MRKDYSKVNIGSVVLVIAGKGKQYARVVRNDVENEIITLKIHLSGCCSNKRYVNMPFSYKSKALI